MLNPERSAPLWRVGISYAHSQTKTAKAARIQLWIRGGRAPQESGSLGPVLLNKDHMSSTISNVYTLREAGFGSYQFPAYRTHSQGNHSTQRCCPFGGTSSKHLHLHLLHVITTPSVPTHALQHEHSPHNTATLVARTSRFKFSSLA